MSRAAGGTYLDRILEVHRGRAHQDTRSVDALADEAKRVDSEPRGFRAALQNADAPTVIAEIKRRSPSKGDLNARLDAGAMAAAYQTGGAACLSVLTDVDFFGGSVDDLQVARAATGLPALRKDFTVGPADVCDARIMGADAVLLIVSALDDSELADFHALAREVGLDVLVEVHDEAELDRALAAGADLVGVNQRDLVTFQVDHERAVRVAKAMPPSVVKVAESGIRGPQDAGALAAAGFDAILVGESLVTAPDPAVAVSALLAK
jgi:indole-3-glycerol phosphate synthase